LFYTHRGINMKKFLVLLSVLMLVSIGSAQMGKERSLLARRVVVDDSLRIAPTAPTNDVVNINAISPTTTQVDALRVNITTTDGTNLTNTAIYGTVSAVGTASGDIARGLFLDLSAQAGGTETAIEIENTATWDKDIELQNDEVIVNSTDGTVSITDGTNILFKTVDAGTTGNATVTGTMTVDGVSTLTGAATLTGGYTVPTMTTVLYAAGGAPLLATAGTDIAQVAGTIYWVEVMIPYNVTLTGVTFLVGSVGGTDSVVCALHNSAGTQVAITTRAIAGTAAQLQSIAFTSTYAAVAGKYFISVQANGSVAARLRAYPIPGSKFVASSTTGTFGTIGNLTVGTTFTADKGIISAVY
jgi:hypothetical protein